MNKDDNHALRGVVDERRLIGWRTGDYLYETTDQDHARSWVGNVEVLPIFEGDPNTKLQAAALPAVSGCYTCGHPKHDGYCVDPKWATAAKCDELLSRALRAESALAKAAQPAAQSEFMGWVHEVAWIDGTSRRLHQKEPTPLDDSPGLTSQRVVRVFTQPVVPSVPEAKDEAIPYPGGYPSYESHMRAVAEAKGWNACRATMLAATPQGGADHG